MIRLSKETDYGVIILTQIVSTPEAMLFSARELAVETGIPQPTVSKILKILTRSGILCSQRGAKGGYGLAADPSQISIFQVISVLEGPVALMECIEHPGDCRQEPTCGVKKHWEIINRRVRGTLEEISLAEMARPMGRRLIALESGEIRAN